MRLQIALILVHVIYVMCQEPTIDTKYGKVQGKVDELNGKKYTSFLGIPFAAPPIGKLRYKDPQPPEAWGESVLNAQTFGPACPQLPGMEFTMPLFPKRFYFTHETDDEDCLHLNIYTPGDIAEIEEPLPVLVFIHGGGFIIGAAGFQQGEILVTMGEPIIVVTLQYRLGVLGFLSSGDEALPGNLGYKDQAFALKWIQDNIAAFGGDPQQVTITGESAGGESVLAHMVSPMSSGLFHKACSQSPPPAWVYSDISVRTKYFKQFAEAAGCDRESSEQAIECLQEKPWKELINITEPSYVFTAARVIDGEFITDEPRKLWAEGKYNDAELMYGLTSDDGSMFIDFLYFADFRTNRSKDGEISEAIPSIMIPTMLADDFDWFNPQQVFYKGKELANLKDLSTVVKTVCYDVEKTQLEKARKLLDCSRDVFFLIFGYYAMTEMAKRNDNVYMYVFDHRSDEFPSSDEGGMKLGADHGSDLSFQFGYGFTDPEEAPMTADELTLSRSMIQAWSSYTVGKPSYLNMDGEKIAWPKFTMEEQNVLVFDTAMSEESITDGSDYWTPTLDFWLAIGNLADFKDPVNAGADETKDRKDEL